MPTPDAWKTWRHYFESRLDAEISVPASYRREPVTSEAALAKDKEITFEERGNPVWVELKRAAKATDTEAEGQDLFRGVRERLKLGRAETSP